MPSFEPSLRFTKSGIQPSGSLSESSAKPWFCGVITRPEPAGPEPALEQVRDHSAEP